LSRLIDMMLQSGWVSAIVVVGLVANVFAVAYAFIRHRSTSQTVTKLVDLALGGRADEARIQARNATREIAPLLDALGGDLIPPRGRSPVREAYLIACILMPLAALFVYALSAISANVPQRATVAASFLVGLAILTPFSIAAMLGVIGVGRQTTRTIRGSCVTVLAKQVKTAVDAEIADALRRGNPVRDPRGE
jgi:hypothetical protein